MIPEVTVVDVHAAAAAQTGSASAAQRTVFDIAHFQEAYLRAGQASAAGGDAKVAAPASIGDSEGFRAVLRTLDSLNGRATDLGGQVKVDGSGEMSPGDMMMLTVRCHEFLFHCELTSNVANRSSDGVQQLFRQQT